MILFWLFTGFAIAAVFIVHGTGNLKKIQADWSSYRCNPVYMTLPLFVDVGVDTSTNFQNCMNLIGKEVVGGMTDALGSQFSIIGTFFENISSPLALFRTMISTMRKFVISFATSTLGKVSGPVSMFVYYLNKIQDIMRRVVGEGYIATFFGVTAVSFITGFVSLLLGVIKAFVIAMLIIAIVLALFQPQILAIVLVISSLLQAAGA
jgi:hypothetical protein